jgi:hypothetical protein
LLTEEDLNRLERYIVEKNKLHNRYLHGWGVVCGLEVSCHPCEGFVTVKTGYALSPCGDDIAVCRDEAVDVCELLRRCREDTYRHWECDPAWPRPEPDCDQDQPWVLYICYDEKPSRGITALRGSSGPACCSRCSCGGSSACGCGCHEKSDYPMKSSYAPRQTRALPQCEPTITCEGYTFQLCKAPQPARGQNMGNQDLGKMIGRITECLKELAEWRQAVTALPAASPPSQLNALRENLLLLLERHGISNCDLYRSTLQPWVALPAIDPLLREVLQECVCLALLPPCPEPVEDNCVALATITVNCKEGCRIVRVCNWGHRRIVPTVPSFEYWFEPFLRKSKLADDLAAFCCEKPAQQAPEGPANIDNFRIPAPTPAFVFKQLQDLFKDFLKDMT